MAWYKTGTVTATNGSATITGVGTAFIGNVSVGDGITIAGSTSIHEVVGISSDTQLSIFPVYAGTTGAGKAYGAIPVLGYDKELSDQFNLLRLELGEGAENLTNIKPWATADTPLEARTEMGVAEVSQSIGLGANIVMSQKASTERIRKDVEDATGGRNTVRFTNKGQPCYFYVFPKYNLEDLPGWDPADGTGPHPAFIQNGIVKGEILVGLYQAAEIAGEAVSQAYMAPKVWINYDNARSLCRASGAGFDMMSNWDWSAVAMWCMANGYQPRGNSDYGRSHANKWETGRMIDSSLDLGGPDELGKTTLTGSGPNQWRHDNSPFGIADLVGNVWEWQTGFKLIDGVAHIAPDNGTYTESQYLNTNFSPAIANPWSSTSAVGAPNILKQALIVPSALASPEGGGYFNVEGERIPTRGGNRNIGERAGIGALNLDSMRTQPHNYRGFRLTYRD